MSTQVTLTIPDYVYQQAKQAAQAERRPLADILNEALVQAFPTVHVSPGRAQMEKEQLAFHRLHPELMALYEGQYVAIYQGQVIDHDNDKLALVARIDEKYPSQVVLVKLVTSEPDKIIYARSPRLLK
jgi:hypothetical protein